MFSIIFLMAERSQLFYNVNCNNQGSFHQCYPQTLISKIKVRKVWILIFTIKNRVREATLCVIFGFLYMLLYTAIHKINFYINRSF